MPVVVRMVRVRWWRRSVRGARGCRGTVRWCCGRPLPWVGPRVWIVRRRRQVMVTRICAPSSRASSSSGASSRRWLLLLLWRWWGRSVMVRGHPVRVVRPRRRDFAIVGRVVVPWGRCGGGRRRASGGARIRRGGRRRVLLLRLLGLVARSRRRRGRRSRHRRCFGSPVRRVRVGSR